MSPVWNKILKVWDSFFELLKTEVVLLQQKSFQNFFTIRAGASGNNIEKEPLKPRPKLKKYVCYLFKEDIFSAYGPMQVAVFCKNVLIL